MKKLNSCSGSSSAQIYTAKLVMFLNVGMFGMILLLTLLLSEGRKRVQVLGWICVGFSVSVFVAPLSIIRLVIRTKSVEYMPFSLSFSLTLSAVVWFAYGLLSKDIYVALPNVVGFTFGVLQMVLYIAYKKKMTVIVEHRLPEHIIYPIDPAAEAQPVVVAVGGEEGEKAAADGGHKERERVYHRPQDGEGEEVNRRATAV